MLEIIQGWYYTELGENMARFKVFVKCVLSAIITGTALWVVAFRMLFHKHQYATVGIDTKHQNPYVQQCQVCGDIRHSDGLDWDITNETAN